MFEARLLQGGLLKKVSRGAAALLVATAAVATTERAATRRRLSVVPQAKKYGYGKYCGILIPNPYLSHQPARMGDLDVWRYAVDEIHEAAKARPVDQRKAKVFWRGEHAPVSRSNSFAGTRS